jgi:hydroxyacylglutathione hydrolase
VVDPGDAQVVKKGLDSLAHDNRALHLDAILLTHHHHDHTGGVAELASLTDARVYGPAVEGIAGVTDPLREGDKIVVLGHEWQVLEVPGHTRGHIAYWCEEAGVLFCGDTMFAAGCGRLFEGTAQQMWTSLSRLAALPDTTQVYCAHEYTMSNLRFARKAEPFNLAIADREQESARLRAHGMPTVPFNISTERATNPFLRAGVADIAERAAAMASVPEISCQLPDLRQLQDPVRTFAILRAWKNIT